MSYKRYLFETGGYAAYEHAAKVEEDKTPLYLEYHNNIRGVAANIVAMTMALQSAFNRGALIALGADGYNAPNFTAIRQNSYNDSRPDIIATSFARTPFVGIRKEADFGVILQAKPIDCNLVINQTDKIQENFLKKLFPGYITPTKYSTVGRTIKPDFYVEEGAESSVNFDTVKSLFSTDASIFLADDVRQSPEFSAIRNLPKGLGISFRLVLRTGQARVTDMPYTSASEGGIPNTAAIRLTVQVIPEFHVPVGYAYWCLYCENKTEFVPFMFMSHMNAIVKAASGAVDDKRDAASFISELKGSKATAWKRAKARKPTPISMNRRNSEKEKIMGYVPMIKTDANGYLITSNNHIIRLPTDNKMAEYQDAANQWFESLSAIEVTKMAEGGTDAPKFRFPPSVLFVDHHNEVLVYSTQEGVISSMSLRGARPLDAVTISKVYPMALQSVINGFPMAWTDDKIAKLTYEGKLLINMVKRLNQNKEFALINHLALGACIPPNVGINPIRTNFEDENWSVFNAASRDSAGWGAEEVVEMQRLVDSVNNGTAEEQISSENAIISMLNKGINQIALVLRSAWSAGINDPEASVITNMEKDKDAYIVAMHTENIPAFFEERRTNERDNIVDSLDRDKSIVLPNIDAKSFSFAFPHQGQFIQSVDARSPKAAIIGAAPGGGKTNCIIADILLLLQKKLVKRPVVVVPNNLVRQFCNEINDFTGGKVNAFPFTYQHVRDILMNPYGMNMTMAEVIKFIRDLPPNTIIVTNYNTLRNEYTDTELIKSYEKVSSYDNFGQAKPLISYPFVDILAAAGMDYVCGDESHKIKNAESSLAQAFLALCAKADYIRLSSGTTINNVVTDLFGQMQKINPSMLGGTKEKFAEDFLGGKNVNIISNPAQADRIMSAQRDYALVMQKDSRSWDYMLPKMREFYHRVALTEMQVRYYNVLFEKAVNLISEDSKLKKVFSDLSEADKNKSIPEDEDKANNKIERAIKKHFSIIDRFVNDPGQFTDFADGSFVYEEYKLKNPGGEAEPGSLELANVEDDDLISVKAKRAFDLMYAHMNEKGKLAVVRESAPTWQPMPDNKLIIMAPNKFVGNHVWKFLPKSLKDRSVRYTAGALNKVEQFKNDPEIKFMIADEISISEGHNLQVGSRIIRMQQVWTPGGETQSLARIRRPDPFGKFNRESLGYDIIVATKPNGNPTIDDLRIARLLAKKFNNAMVEFGWEPSFRNIFMKGDSSALPPIRMSMDVIKSFPEELLDAYFAQQKKFNQWFEDSSLSETKKIGKEVEAITGKTLLDAAGKPLNVKEFVAAVVMPTTEGPEIQDSSKCYVPWIPGVAPINPLGFDMQPVRSVTSVPADDDDDDDDEISDSNEDGDDEDADANDLLDNVEVEVGQHVMTEFGPGIIEKSLRSSKKSGSIRLQVIIPGTKGKNNKPLRVRLFKTCVYVPLDDEGAKILDKAIKTKSGSPIRAPTSKDITPKQKQEAKDRKNGAKTPQVDVTDYDDEDDFEEDDFDLDGLADGIDDDEAEDPIDTLIEEEEIDEDIEGNGDDAPDEEESDPTVDAAALAVNGQLAVVADDSGDGKVALNLLFTRYGYHVFPDMARIKFTTRKALDTFIARLAKAKFAIPRNLQNEIDLVANGLTARGKLHQVTPFDYSEVTNFMKTEQRKVPVKIEGQSQTIRLYPLVTDGQMYLCASISKHPFNVVNALTRLAQGIPGVGKVQKRENMGIKFYRSLVEAKKEAKKIINDGDIINDPQGFLDSFDTIQGGHIEMPLAGKPNPKQTITPVDNKPKPSIGRPTTKPVAKPIAKPASVRNATEQYDEETHNPAVEDASEFKAFLAARRPTVMLYKGGGRDWDELRGVPLRVRAYSGTNFSVAPYVGAPKSEWVQLSLPKGTTFNPDKGTMTTPSGNVWMLSYAG